MDGIAPSFPHTVDEIFTDFKGRRAGLIKALTTDVEDLYRQCDPAKENLCLYGFPDESWVIDIPAEQVPPEFPEPALGINFARDGMKAHDWLNLVAVHCDSWLLAVAFYFGARRALNSADRKKLFSMINDLPTLFEVVIGEAFKRQQKEKSNHSSDKSSSKQASESQGKYSEAIKPKNDDESNLEDDDEHGETLCGACGDHYAKDEFWVCCDICEKWFHGKCVMIAPSTAADIKQYICPSCSNSKKACP